MTSSSNKLEITHSEKPAIIAQAVEVATQKFPPELQSLKEGVVDAVRRILGNLPEIVSGKRVVASNCQASTDEEVEVLQTIFPDNHIQIQELREDICASIALFLHRDSIDTTVHRMTLSLQSEYDKGLLPRWGLTSIKKTGVGTEFNRFWKRYIEKRGTRIFEEVILPRLPLHLQEKFKPNVCACKERTTCKYDWSRMKDTEIAEVIMGLDKAQDPETEEWGIGSIASWTRNGKNTIGYNFYKYWNSKKHWEVEFREKILPHFPEKMRQNFVAQSYSKVKWRKLSSQESAQFLVGLATDKVADQDPNKTGWCLKTICSWKDENGVNLGSRFHNSWTHRTSQEKKGALVEFESLILPHLPATWRVNYKSSST